MRLFFKKLGKPNPVSKYKGEVDFWRKTVVQIIDWYEGRLAELYSEPSPAENQKVKVKNLKDTALLTFFNIHQKKKYAEDLQLPVDAFRNMKILDIGSGPFPSARVFEGSEVYCLDPLFPAYLDAGFPIHYYEDVKFIHAFAEDIPVEDKFFDAVISVNAIDHVDSFEKTALEIKRVLKANGKLRLHIHYHEKTLTEPIELNDGIVQKTFSWCNGFKKISESNKKRGHTIANPNEKYTLWSNF